MSTRTAVNKAKPTDGGPRPIFCYGTLMHPVIYLKVVGKSEMPKREAAILKRFRRRKVLHQAYPAIASGDADDQVEGYLVHVQAEDIALLDLFESDDYERITVTVHLCSSTESDASQEADVYVWRKSKSRLSENEDWSYEKFVETKLKEWTRDIDCFPHHPEEQP
ncbi:hypothetical protein DFJ77DRAFT_479824 [Powellomyces hirtus]|nr:hypothetical protein DFJ77DRAFT_479824 [Powellomyces hirtus]